MEKEKKKDVEFDNASIKADQDSKVQSSAEEQKKNIPQSTKNAAEENKPVSQQGKGSESLPEQTTQSTPDILGADVTQIFGWLEEANQSPRQLKGLLDTLETKIELIEKILTNQSEKTKRIPGIDRRIETLDLFDEQIETGDRYLSGLNKIKLQTELTNLREKRFEVWQKFVKVCGSEKKALQYQHLRAKAKSKRYHKKYSYFIKQRILKILNIIINKDKPALVEVKMVADDTSDDGVKLFNERMRDLLYVHDDECVLLCSHVNRALYFKIMQSTVLEWNPDSDVEIDELVIANESE